MGTAGGRWVAVSGLTWPPRGAGVRGRGRRAAKGRVGEAGPAGGAAGGAAGPLRPRRLLSLSGGGFRVPGIPWLAGRGAG